jgi:hypothetical protein
MLEHSPTWYKNILQPNGVDMGSYSIWKNPYGFFPSWWNKQSTKIFLIPVSTNYIGKPSWVFPIMNRTQSTKTTTNTMYGITLKGYSHNEKNPLQPKLIEWYCIKTTLWIPCISDFQIYIDETHQLISKDYRAFQ